MSDLRFAALFRLATGGCRSATGADGAVGHYAVLDHPRNEKVDLGLVAVDVSHEQVVPDQSRDRRGESGDGGDECLGDLPVRSFSYRKIQCDGLSSTHP